MPYTAELADSELLDLVRDGPQVRLRLAAAAARDDAGMRGWLGGVTLTLADAAIDGAVEHAFGRIATGAVRDGQRELPRLAVPGELAGPVTLRLGLANGTQVVVRSASLAATLAADARFREDWSC